jgi:hypothetical protein
MVGQHLLDDIKRLKHEAEFCYVNVVLPNWGSENLHGFPDILYGLLMGVMSRIDLMSCYYDNNSISQTERMINFLNKFVTNDNELNSALIHIWRHQLMHTSAPREFTDTNSNTRYNWLLHWREHLPIEQHYTLIVSGNTKTFNLGLIYLIDQITDATSKYLKELNNSVSLQTNYFAVERKLNNVKKKIS